MTRLKKILFVVSLLSAVVILLNGCKKKTEPVEPSASEITSQVVADIEQKTCPVMGRAIDKNIYTEYKGKKVYFCCSGCKEAFEKEPEKYLSKLPQFSK